MNEHFYVLALPHISPIYFKFQNEYLFTDVIQALSIYWSPYFLLKSIVTYHDIISVEQNFIMIDSKPESIIPFKDHMALFQILNGTFRRNAICEKKWHVLHASSFDINNKSFIFTGQSGSGKSTLVAYLLSRDPEGYNGDDFVIINCENNMIEPVNRSVFLRDTSLSVLNCYNDNISNNVKYSCFLNRQYLDIKRRITQKNKLIHGIFNLNYDSNIRRPCLRRIMDPSFLINNSFLSLNNIKNNIEASLIIFSRNRYYNLFYNDLNDLYAFLETI